MEKGGNIFRSALVREGATLISGNIWAQLIALLGYLLLARLYTPDDFGLFNMFFSYIEVLIILSTCKYELGVVLADNEREATALSRLAMRLNLLVATLLLVGLVGVRAAVPQGVLGRSNATFAVALMVPLMVYFNGTSRVYAALCNRVRNFRQIALSEVVGSTTGLVSKLLLGLPRLAATVWHTLGLPIGAVLGKVAANINYWFTVRRLHLPRDISRDERLAAGRKFRNFPLYTMPKDLINSFSYNLPFIWLALYFDRAEVGLLGMALTCTFRPVNILNTAFEKLFYVRVAEKVRSRERVLPDLLSFVKWLNICTLPFFVLLFLFAGPLLGFLLGDKWAACEYYVRVLLPWVYVMLTSTSLMFIANVFGRQRTEFRFYVVLLVLRVGAVVAGIVLHDFRLAIALFGAAGLVVSSALLVWYFRLVRGYERGLAGR